MFRIFRRPRTRKFGYDEIAHDFMPPDGCLPGGGSDTAIGTDPPTPPSMPLRGIARASTSVDIPVDTSAPTLKRGGVVDAQAASVTLASPRVTGPPSQLPPSGSSTPRDSVPVSTSPVAPASDVPALW